MKKKSIPQLEFSNSDVYSSISSDYSRAVTVVDGVYQTLEDEDFGIHMDLIAQIHDFVRYISSVEFEISGEPYWGKRASTDPIQKKLTSFFEKFTDMCDERERKRPFRYSEQVELFWDQVDQYLKSVQHLGIPNYLDSYNECIKRIIAASRSSDYRRRLDSRQKSVVHNYQSVSTHAALLFKKHAQLHVVRIDLLTSRLTKLTKPKPIDVESLHELRKIFLKDNHRKALFKNVAGYVWKLEYSEIKGSYIHFILYLQNSDLLLTDYIADQFGKFWVESVTNNQGSYLICKAGVALRRSSVTGVVMVDEKDVFTRLSVDLKCLMMKDFYLLPDTFVIEGKRRKKTYDRSEVK